MNKSLRNWAIPIGLTLISFAIALTGDAGRVALQYLGSTNESSIDYLSYRWITGHFTHVGWGHMLLNLVGLAAIWTMYGQIIVTSKWLLFLLLCPVGISLGFSLLSPGTIYYVGLSGVLHGMLAMVAILSLFLPLSEQVPNVSRNFKWEDLIVLFGLWGKIIYEQTIGAVPMTAAIAGDTVVTTAHLYGAFIGTGFALVLLGYTFVNYKTNS